MNKMTDLTIDFTEEPLERIQEITDIFAGNRRVEMLKYICGGKDWNATELAKKLDCGISNVSQQAQKLEKAGLIIKETAKSVGNNIKIFKPVYKRIIFKLADD